MKKAEPSLDEELISEYERWNHLYTHGGQDPFWSDGCNMSLVRNQIINTKRKMENSGKLTDTYYQELPPEVDRNYMARAEEIKINAFKSLSIYKKDSDYLYLLDSIKKLSERQKKDTCITAVIGYVKGLEQHIKNNDSVAMRRHENTKSYIESFVICTKKVQEILGNEKKVIVTHSAEPVQMTIFDYPEVLP
jgi:hypothetical protein